MKKAIELRSIKEVLGSKTHLLFYLLNNMDNSNTVRKSRKEICQEVSINEQMLSKQLRELKSIDLISIENHQIIFNQYFVSKGQVKNHPNAV